MIRLRLRPVIRWFFVAAGLLFCWFLYHVVQVPLAGEPQFLAAAAVLAFSILGAAGFLFSEVRITPESVRRQYFGIWSGVETADVGRVERVWLGRGGVKFYFYDRNGHLRLTISDYYQDFVRHLKVWAQAAGISYLIN